MASLLRKLFGLHKKKKPAIKKDSVTGRDTTFPVPYLSRLEGHDLQSGQSLVVRGTIIGREEFIINLTTGPRVELDDDIDTLDDRLLSIRVDVSAKRVFLNACIKGEWGKEGAVKHTWGQGDDFDIRVRCHSHAYDIFVDYKLVATFAHYVPLTSVTHLYINGDVELCAVSWEGKNYQLPYVADIPDNLYPGRKLHVTASVANDDEKKVPKSFSIDFNAGPDVALHFEVNVKAKKVFRSARLDGEWTVAESNSLISFPFKRRADRLFNIVIYCRETQFLIYVNDTPLGSFEHRTPPAKIDKVAIQGDIVLHGVHLK